MSSERRDAFEQIRKLSKDWAASGGTVRLHDNAIPIESDVIAELKYVFDGTTWSAIVTRSENLNLPGLQLWYRRGARLQKSGTFEDGGTLMKHILEQAHDKFKGYTPIKNTLNRLKSKNLYSLVPDCHHAQARQDVCQSCPYEESCFPPGGVPPFMRKVKGLEGVVEYIEEDIEKESESTFLERLQAKVKDRWGK